MSYPEKHNYTTLKEIYKNIDNYILLTSSQILTNHYKNKLNSIAAKDHSTFWETVPVLQLNLWAKNLYLEIKGRKTIANQTYKIMLAYKIITNVNSDLSTKTAMQMARKAIATFNYCKKWHIPYSEISHIEITPSHTIAKVIQSIAADLEHKNLIDETGIIASISNAITSKSLDIKKSIVLVGFEYLDPTTLDLITALSSATNVSWLDNKRPSEIKWTKSKDAKSAYYDFAAWHKTLPAGATVGFFTPTPNNTETFRYAKIAIKDSHIKTNQSIYDFEIIKSALLLLELTTNNIKTSSLTKLILSSHLLATAIDEKVALVHYLEQNLYKCEEYTSITNILNILEGAPRNEAAKSLINAINLINSAQNSAKLQDHINNFKQILKTAKWPITQSTNEQQIALELPRLLTKIANACSRNTLISTDEAYDIISEMLESHKILLDDSKASVQICDIITGSFLCYDYAWIEGLNSSKWPTYSKAKTFIKQHIIEQYTYSESEQIAMSKHALDRIAKSSLISIYNYADTYMETEDTPSHMIKDILANSEQLILTNNIQHDYNNFCTAGATTARISEENIPLHPHEKSINTYTIKDFNTCHFKSFAKFRLTAKELASPSLGLRAVDKGIIIHDVLQNIYSNINRLHELQNITEEKVAELVYKHIRNMLKYKPASAPKSFIKSECKNITTIILAWMQYDLNREDCQIYAAEQEITLKLNGIAIRGIIDRIDKLNSGNYTIIDYKTGAANASNWFTDTITEPQMPIYSIAYDNKLSATCYGHISSKEPYFSGISDTSSLETKSPQNTPEKSISEIVAQWRISIEDTLSKYATGSIQTITENITTECNKCPYSGICRIWEKTVENS